jgi:hypothetical protein
MVCVNLPKCDSQSLHFKTARSVVSSQEVTFMNALKGI